VPDLDGYKILLIYSGDTYDLCRNWGHLRYLRADKSRRSGSASPILFLMG
jgi:hypothetical protein